MTLSSLVAASAAAPFVAPIAPPIINISNWFAGPTRRVRRGLGPRPEILVYLVTMGELSVIVTPWADEFFFLNLHFYTATGLTSSCWSHDFDSRSLLSPKILQFSSCVDASYSTSVLYIYSA